MWTGSSGPYRPAQPGQSPHATWTSGIDARPVRTAQPQVGATGSPVPYVDAQQRAPLTPQPSGSGPSSSASTSKDGIPEPPKAFPELESMPLKDLRVLHDEKAKFEDFVSKHSHQKVVDEVVARIKGEVETFQREHEAITERMEEVVDEEGLAEIRRKITEMEEEVSGLQKLKDEWMEHNSPERLMERLRMAIAESESVSEGLEKSMLSSSMNFDEFLAQYISCRKKYHERSLKLEQLKQESRKRSFSR